MTPSDNLIISAVEVGFIKEWTQEDVICGDGDEDDYLCSDCPLGNYCNWIDRPDYLIKDLNRLYPERTL